jgi:hypothetical protein
MREKWEKSGDSPLTERARTDTLKCDEVSEQSRVVTVSRNKGTDYPAEIITWPQQVKRTSPDVSHTPPFDRMPHRDAVNTRVPANPSLAHFREG